MAELKKVLIVDDEKDLASAISAYLTLKGYATTICLEGKDAFQKTRNAQYDIIITDFRMPKLNGADLINSFRSSSFNESTPIILSSGFQDEALQELKGVNLSNVRILPKPFKMENLLKVLTEHESKRPQTTSSAPAKLNVNFINLFINATGDVLAEIAAVTAIKASPPKLLSKDVDIKADISGVIILISKDFQGSISFSFKATSYLQIINKFKKAKFETINEDNADFLPEIISSICKKMNVELAKNRSEVKRTNTVVFATPNHNLPDSGNPRTLLLTIDSSIGNFWITIVLNQSAG